MPEGLAADQGRSIIFMKSSVFALSIVIFSATPSLRASETIDRVGSYRSTSSPWDVTIQEDKPPKFGYHRKGAIDTSISPSAWLPHKTWFVFIEDDFHLWAFDGIDKLLLVKITKEGGVLYDLDSLPNLPPTDVLDRLPAAFRKKVTSKIK